MNIIFRIVGLLALFFGLAGKLAAPSPPVVSPGPSPVIEVAISKQVEPQPALGVLRPFEGNYEPNQRYHAGHYGVDYPTHYLTNVLACDDGVVESNTYSDLYGNHIWVRHSWGKSLYAHLDDWDFVAVGQSVVRGERIAQSGDSGDSFDANGARAPHFHFAIQIDGQWVNPLNYIKE